MEKKELFNKNGKVIVYNLTSSDCSGALNEDLQRIAAELLWHCQRGKNYQIIVSPYTEPEISRNVVAYWYGEVVNKIRMGLNELGYCYSDSSTEDFIHKEFFKTTPISFGRTIYTKSPEGVDQVSFELLCRFASSVRVDRTNGKIDTVVPVISKMDRRQLSKLFDPIIAWASQELGMVIFEFDEWQPL